MSIKAQAVTTRIVEAFALIATLASCLLVLGLITHLVAFYGIGDHALNSGIVVGTSAHNVGYEFVGDPGFFVDGN